MNIENNDVDQNHRSDSFLGLNNEEFDPSLPCPISFRNVYKYINRRNSQPYPIIANLSGNVKPGEMLAIMGMSGSGKSTLLSTIGGRMTEGVYGQVLIQRKLFTKRMRPHIAYIWQDDLFYPSSCLSTLDVLMFAAMMKIPSQVPYPELQQAVDRALDQMHLKHCAHTYVGLISGGEKRRLTIAKELLSRPKVLLVDEGTSGLDSAAAFDLLTQLKELAMTDQIPVLAVIHQPSTRAFYLFNTVLMLSEGYCVYRGSPAGCLPYLASAGFPSPPMEQISYNPADFMIDILYSQELCSMGNGSSTTTWPRYALIAAWVKRERLLATPHDPSQDLEAAGECIENVPQTTDMQPTSLEMHSPADPTGSAKSAVSCWDSVLGGSWQGAARLLRWARRPGDYKSSYTRQFYAAFNRALYSEFGVQFGLVNVVQTLFMALVVGLCWFQVPLEEDRAGDLAGYAFFVSAYWFFTGMFTGMQEFLPERPVLQRELGAGEYRLSAYYLAKTCASLLVQLPLPLAFLALSYFLAFVDCRAETYFSMAGVVVLGIVAGNSIGAFIGTLTVDYHIATSLSTVVTLAMLITGGFYLKELPPWLDFFGVLSAFRYAYRASVQLAFMQVRCLECMGGYWLSACIGREYGSCVGGGAVTDSILGATVDPLGWNIAALLAFGAVFRLLGYLSLLVAEYNTIFTKGVK